MVAMPGEIVERSMHPAKKTGFDQLELDLLQRAAMKLLGNLNF